MTACEAPQQTRMVLGQMMRSHDSRLTGLICPGGLFVKMPSSLRLLTANSSPSPLPQEMRHAVVPPFADALPNVSKLESGRARLASSS